MKSKMSIFYNHNDIKVEINEYDTFISLGLSEDISFPQATVAMFFNSFEHAIETFKEYIEKLEEQKEKKTK